jgi:ERCC4-type nuclease
MFIYNIINQRYQFYQQKTQLKEVLHISIMIISYGTINLSTLSNKLLYNKLVNVKFSKLISAYHWIPNNFPFEK